ncbi:MAG: iron-sulfur cluster repair di-iron protein [Acidobacteriota bacterium]
MNITPTTGVGELAAAAPAAIRVFQRHGIDFCCGGKLPLQEACDRHQVPFSALKGELEAALAPSPEGTDWNHEPLGTLIEHIVSRYHDDLRHELPRLEAMAAKVNERHGPRHPELFPDLLLTVQGMRTELEQHIAEEERSIFPRLARLGTELAEEPAALQTIQGELAHLREDHQEAGDALAHLRELTGGFNLPPDACMTFRGLYVGLADLERDLQMHVHLENNILFPRAAALLG